MSIEILEQEVAELRRRLEKMEAKLDGPPREAWREVVGSIVPNELTREAARLGAEWRAAENQRT